MGANKSANFVNILVPKKWLWEETTLGFPFSSPPPPMRESGVHPQMITSVYSIWYLDFGTQKERTLLCDGRKLKRGILISVSEKNELCFDERKLKGDLCCDGRK